MKLNKKIVNSTLFIFILYLRYRWSSISQWREDSATNIWLSYTKELSEIPVGILSSKMIPNPNGIIIFGKIFTFFESVLYTTFFLSTLQVFLFFLLSKEISSNKILNNFVFLLLSFSTIISSSSVEFWNNWILILFHILFFIFLFKYLNTENSKFLIAAACMPAIPVSIYLAGIVNSLIYTLLIFLSLLVNKNYKRVKFKVSHIAMALIFYILNFFYVWKPFFSAIKLSEVYGFSGLSLYDRVNYFSDIFLELPGSFLTFWTQKNAFYINHIDITGISNVHTRTLHELFKIYIEFHKVVIVIFLTIIFIGLKELIKSDNSKIDKELFRKLILFFTFITVSVLVNPILGGPNFVNYERVENMNQFYPFYLLIWFCVPYIFLGIIFQKRIIQLNYIVFSIFMVINIALSFTIFSDSLNYDGNKLIEADVPLIHKIQVVDFIGEKILEDEAGLNIAISYDLGGGVWEWIPTHGEYFSEWYTDNPFTIGRIFDYQLLRKYSINNTYEGLNTRNFSDSDYIVSYKFKNHKVLDNNDYEHYYFGRLRVSKLLKNK